MSPLPWTPTLALFLLTASFLTPGASAQILLRDRLTPAEVESIDGTTRAHWERAEQFLTQQQWGDAVDALRRGLEGEAGRFVAMTGDGNEKEGGFTTFIPLRHAAQLKLISWKLRAPAALEQYRQQSDKLAADWLARGKTEREETLLRRVLEQAYVSRAAEEALRQLGELALARGHYTAARNYFEQLHPALTVSPAAAKELRIPAGISWWLVLRRQNLAALWPRFERWLADLPTDPPERLAFPDPTRSLADGWARLVLVSILEGSHDRAELELQILKRLAPEAEGQLAGRNGAWAKLLETLLNESRDWPPRELSRNWPTFAGTPERNGIAVARNKDFALGLRPRWTHPLPKLKSEKELLAVGRERVGEDSAALLSYFPVVIGETVLVRSDAAGNSYVAALDLASGGVQWQVDYPRSAGPEKPPRTEEPPAGNEVNDAHAGLVRHIGVARYTGHVTGEQAFFRIGPPISLTSERKISRLLVKDQGALLGLDLQTQGKPLEGFPIVPESPAWGFEGTPLATAEALFVLTARREGTHAQSYVAAYELSATPRPREAAPAARPTGKLLWRSKIASSASLGRGEIDELTHNLLALHEETLYANTNRGIVAALDRQTGEVRWLTRYPRADFDAADDAREETFQRDLNPCLIYRDLVIVAPADCRQIFALHAGTGRLVWSLPAGVAADAMHLLGVTGEHLILSGDYLYYVDVWSGRVVTQFPAPVITGTPRPAPSPCGYGRGVIAGERIFWPTRDRLYVFENRVEKQGPRFEPKLAQLIDLAPRGLTGGNLLLIGNTLLIASGDKLWGVSAE